MLFFEKSNCDNEATNSVCFSIYLLQRTAKQGMNVILFHLEMQLKRFIFVYHNKSRTVIPTQRQILISPMILSGTLTTLAYFGIYFKARRMQRKSCKKSRI